MRALAVVLACALPGMAGAGCLAPGQMPVKVSFASGDLMDTIVRDGDHLTTVTHLASGITTTADTLWGFYPAGGSVDGTWIGYQWKRKKLPDPAGMKIGKTVTFRGAQEMGGGSSPFVMEVTPVAREEVQVGGCTYPVLHITTREGKPGNLYIQSDYWLDTDRRIVWARETQFFDGAGNPDEAVHIKAVAAE